MVAGTQQRLAKTNPLSESQTINGRENFRASGRISNWTGESPICTLDWMISVASLPRSCQLQLQRHTQPGDAARVRCFCARHGQDTAIATPRPTCCSMPKQSWVPQMSNLRISLDDRWGSHKHFFRFSQPFADDGCHSSHHTTTPQSPFCVVRRAINHFPPTSPSQSSATINQLRIVNFSSKSTFFSPFEVCTVR